MLVFTTAVTLLAVAGMVWADQNVQAVQEKLRDGGFYSGEIDGAYSSDLSAALTRYQIRNGLPITGQLDEDTGKALGAKPAVTDSASDAEQSSETWRRLRRGQHKTSANARRTPSPGADETENSTELQRQSARATVAGMSSEVSEPASTPPATTQTSSENTAPAPAPQAADSGAGINTERLHDYVAAFVLAGLDRNVGAEAEFFADRVDYYNSGQMDREKIREDLKRYDAKWPERHFWLAGKITIEPQRDNRLRVTFPLGFKLRNGNRQSSGKVDKTLVLEPAGDDFAIVAVNEVSESKK